MTSAQVVETSVTNNSSFQNYPHPDDHTIRTTDTPWFKPFTIERMIVLADFDMVFDHHTVVQTGCIVSKSPFIESAEIIYTLGYHDFVTEIATLSSKQYRSTSY